MKIEITRELKIKLLTAISSGIFDTDLFPELSSTTITWVEEKTYTGQPEDNDKME